MQLGDHMKLRSKFSQGHAWIASNPRARTQCPPPAGMRLENLDHRAFEKQGVRAMNTSTPDPVAEHSSTETQEMKDDAGAGAEDGSLPANVTVSRRKCAKCGVVKPASCFYRNKWAPTGLHHYCRPCEAKRQKLYTRSKVANGDGGFKRTRRAFGSKKHRGGRGGGVSRSKPAADFGTDEHQRGSSSDVGDVRSHKRFREEFRDSVTVSEVLFESEAGLGQDRASGVGLVERSRGGCVGGRKRVAERCHVVLEEECEKPSKKRWRTIEDWFEFCSGRKAGIEEVMTPGAVRRRFGEPRRGWTATELWASKERPLKNETRSQTVPYDELFFPCAEVSVFEQTGESDGLDLDSLQSPSASQQEVPENSPASDRDVVETVSNEHEDGPPEQNQELENDHDDDHDQDHDHDREPEPVGEGQVVLVTGRRVAVQEAGELRDFKHDMEEGEGEWSVGNGEVIDVERTTTARKSAPVVQSTISTPNRDLHAW